MLLVFVLAAASSVYVIYRLKSWDFHNRGSVALVYFAALIYIGLFLVCRFGFEQYTILQQYAVFLASANLALIVGSRGKAERAFLFWDAYMNNMYASKKDRMEIDWMRENTVVIKANSVSFAATLAGTPILYVLIFKVLSS